jgi:molybdenum cofactor biosynthesis enzyme MoaA
MFSRKEVVEYPRLVAIETTNRCNATCKFCPNSVLGRDRRNMTQELFEKIIDDCRAFPLKALEPFLNGEPFMDPKILERLEHIRRTLPATKLRLYTNGNLMTPAKLDALSGLGIDHLYVSLNTLNPEKYREVMGLDLDKTLTNLRYLTDPARRGRIARQITFRMTRTSDTSLEDQRAFVEFCDQHKVRNFIVGLFNYKGFVSSTLPVPNYPCENLTRLDILASGVVTLCCMDQEGEFAWGDINQTSVLDAYNSPVARKYRGLHRTGRRREMPPCNTCNLFWPSFERTAPAMRARFGVEAALYFLKYKPCGVRPVPAAPKQ